jgi:hypothetical protein
VVQFSIDSVQFQAQPYFPGLQGGAYIVYAQDTNGCIQSQPVTIYEPTAPTIQLAGDDLTCFGSNDGRVIATVTGGSYIIADYTLNGTTQTSPYFHNLGAGNYTMICTDTSGCAYSETITLSQPAQIVIDSLYQTPATCNGFNDGSFEAFVSGGSGSFTYSLNGAPFQTTAVFDTLAAGMYYLTIKDSAGCETIEMITITQPPAVHITPYVTPATCYKDRDGEIIVITSGGAVVADFSLNGGPWQPSNTFPELPAGVHHVVVRDTYGCEYDTYVEVTEPDAIDISGIITAVGDLASIDITIVGGNGGFTFEWSNGDTTQNLAGLQGGVYRVTVTDSLGCSESEIFVVEGTSIPNLPTDDLVFVYPNPTQDKVNVDLELERNKEVVIETLDVVGQVVGITPAEVLRTDVIEVDLTGFARGIYMLRIILDGEAYVTKVMKE